MMRESGVKFCLTSQDNLNCILALPLMAGGDVEQYFFLSAY
jgi:hypothetical protein